ncbi:MAG: NAD(P)-dependent oxidoreductase [Proteobacteria bacterium]|nr:NAD(P)-dependent oxidoreductase [Pseudomonadota bacterium]
MEQELGLIGLGNAGLALAAPILKQYSIVGFDLDPARCALAANMGVKVVASARALAQRCEIVLLSLPNPAISKSVLEAIGADALAKRTVVETSTVTPEDIEALLAIAAPAGASIVESAIIGGVHKLAAGEGTFLVAAAEQDYRRVEPILQAAAEKIFFLGPLGNAMRAKLVCNGVAHAVMVVIIEAAALAAAQNVPLDVFYELMRRDSGLMRPLTHRFGERILKQDFEGGMSTTNARKDSALILDVAKNLGVPLFATAAAHSVYEIAMREGLEKLDYAAISKLWEKWLGVSFAAK